MNVNTYISSLASYDLTTELIEDCDKTYITNQLLQVLQLDTYEEADPLELPPEDILKGLLDDAVARNICTDDITSRDLFDTKIMGVLTHLPRKVRSRFKTLYAEDPMKATQWYYAFSQNTDYIRCYRICKDLRWKTSTEHGDLGYYNQLV